MSDAENKKKARIVEFAAGRMMKDEYKVRTLPYQYKFYLNDAKFPFRPRKSGYLVVERLNFHQTIICELSEIHVKSLIISSPRNSSSWKNVKRKTKKRLKSKKSKQLKHQQQQRKLLQQHRRQHQLLQPLLQHPKQQLQPRLVSNHSFFISESYIWCKNVS